MPLVQQWNLGFQRQLPLSLTLEVNYVGNHALHLSYNVNENISSARVGACGDPGQHQRRDPECFAVPESQTVHSEQQYRRLQLQRVAGNSPPPVQHGLLFSPTTPTRRAWTMAAPSTTSRLRMEPQTRNTLSPVRTSSQDLAPSNIDVKHVLNIAIVYTTPGPWWLRNWHISPVFVGHTGLPVNITQTNEIPGSSQRPNGNPQLLKLANPTMNGAALQYYDSADRSEFPADGIRAGLQHH